MKLEYNRLFNKVCPVALGSYFICSLKLCTFVSIEQAITITIGGDTGTRWY